LRYSTCKYPVTLKPGLGVTQGHRKLYHPNRHRFRDKRRSTSKIAQKSPIPPPVYFTPPMKGFPLEFGIGVRGPECFSDGVIRRSKKFSDRFSRFDTIPAVTDTHPATHPASQPRCRSYYAQR